MSNEKPKNNHDVHQPENEDEYVVPHMNVGCIVNSVAYFDVMRNPTISLHGFKELNASAQKSVIEFCAKRMSELEKKNRVPPPNPSVSSMATSSTFETDDQHFNGDSTDEDKQQRIE